MFGWHREKELSFATDKMRNHRPKQEKKIDEKEADILLSDIALLKDAVFRDADDEDSYFRVVEGGMTNDLEDPFWEILFEGTGYPMRMERDELRDLMIGSTCKYF